MTNVQKIRPNDAMSQQRNRPQQNGHAIEEQQPSRAGNDPHNPNSPAFEENIPYAQDKSSKR